jgi:SPP1 gp7 family putative phage head morphogenesis protein
MGLFDFLNRAQEKLNNLQKRIETFSPDELFVHRKKDRKTEAPESVSKQILAQRDSLIRNGFKRYEFLANHDCCEVCGKLHGKSFSLSKLEIGVNAPPMHEGCSCSIAAWSDRKEYEEWLSRF